MKRICWSFAGALLVPFAHWLGGFDFDQRGAVAVGCFVFSLMAGLFVYGFPGWDDRS